MQNDDMIWQIINKDFCSFKITTLREDLCRNEYNVSGKCNRVSCPLANSNYGTVLHSNGHLFLCLKTVERAHLPRTMWERIRLPLDVDRAKGVIEEEMKNVYKSHQIERCKRRAVKLKQMLDRMRRMELKIKERLVPVKKKTEKREATREKKAEVAARLEDVIELELMKRLQQGVYGRLYSEERCKKTQGDTAVEEESLTQTRVEETGRVTILRETEATDEELPNSDSEAEDDFRGDAVSDVSASEDDVEDLALASSIADPSRNPVSCASLQGRAAHIRTGELSATQDSSKRWAAYTSEKGSSVARKRARFFDVKRAVSIKSNIPISYENNSECL